MARAATASRELRVFVCPPLDEFAQRVGHIRCASADVVVKVRSGEREEEREKRMRSCFGKISCLRSVKVSWKKTIIPLHSDRCDEDLTINYQRHTKKILAFCTEPTRATNSQDAPFRRRSIVSLQALLEAWFFLFRLPRVCAYLTF